MMQLVRRMASALARQTKPQKPYSSGRIFVRKPEAGVYVDPDVSLEHAAVMSCVHLISQTIGHLPWNVFRSRTNGIGADRVTTHPIVRLLDRAANPEVSSGHWRETMISWALTWGNGYSEIEKDISGRANALRLIHPSTVRVGRNDEGELTYYVTQEDGIPITIPPRKMFHLKGMGFDGLVGYSPIAMAARAVSTGIALDQFAGSFFGNGAWPGGFIKPPAQLGDTERKEWLKSLEERHKGAGRAHRIGLLPFGSEWVPLSLPNDQAQFLESRKFQVVDICRIFRVPPHKVYELDGATFSNITEQNLEWIQDQIPWVRRLEQEADIKLFGDKNTQDFTRIDLAELQRADPSKRVENTKTLLTMGVITINEARQREEMNPIGPDGDVHLVAANFQTLERALDPPEPTPMATPPETPEVAGDENDGETEDPRDLARVRRAFLESVVERHVRKEAYAVRDAAAQCGGDATAFSERMIRFIDRQRSELNSSLDTVLRNCYQDKASYGVASVIEAHLHRLLEVVDKAHIADDSCGYMMELETDRVADLCDRIEWSIENVEAVAKSNG